MVSGMVVLRHEGRDPAFEIAGQVVMLKQDAVLEGLIAAEGAVLHVALHNIDAVLVRKLDARRFIEGDNIPQRDEPRCPVLRLTNICAVVV